MNRGRAAIVSGWVLGYLICYGLTWAALAEAEASRAVQVTGRVVDIGGQPIVDAVVRLTSIGRVTQAALVHTDKQGRFMIEAAPGDAYELWVDASGFLRYTQRINGLTSNHNAGTIVARIGEITEGPMVPVKPKRAIKPITVCQALGDRARLTGKPAAVVGRLDCGHSLTDRVCFVAQDSCGQPVMTDGYVWPNKIVVIDYWEEGMPRPPVAPPIIDRNALKKTLGLVRETTKLGTHKEATFKAEDRSVTLSHYDDANDEWAVIYGVVLTAPDLRLNDCGNQVGCGGFSGAPAGLITAPSAIQTIATDKEAKPRR